MDHEYIKSKRQAPLSDNLANLQSDLPGCWLVPVLTNIYVFIKDDNLYNPNLTRLDKLPASGYYTTREIWFLSANGALV